MYPLHFLASCIKVSNGMYEKNILVSFSLLKSSLVQQGRNLLTCEFINAPEKYDYLLFIDSDIDFQPETIFTMIKKIKI